MYQGPTELLRIGCLRESIWTPKIQIRYIDTKHQLEDILTKGNFTRDEWNNLLHLFNISNFSSLCCAQNFRLTGCPKKIAKRMQEQKGEEIIVAESRPTAMNLSSTVPASSSSAKNPITSSDPEKLMTPGKSASRTRRNSKLDESVEFSSAGERCTPWRVDE